MKKHMPWILCAVFFISGCATTSQFVYNHPTDFPEAKQENLVAAVVPIIDLRKGDKEIDKIYSDSPLVNIQKIIQEELRSTGLFKKVISISKADEENGADIMVEPSLAKLEWVVPNYDELVGKAFAVSVLTGGIGGAIYGSTDVDVYGNTSLHVKVMEISNGKVLLEKTYDGHCEEKMIKFKCDTPETKAKMIGTSLKQSIEAMKTDLKEAISERVQ